MAAGAVHNLWGQFGTRLVRIVDGLTHPHVRTQGYSC